MWTFHLIDGLDDGRFAFYVKVHHAVMDGVAGLQMIAHALSTDPARRSMPPLYGAQHDVSTSADRRLPNPFTVLRSLLGGATSGAALVENVITGEISNLVASLTTDATMAPAAAPYRRFFNGRIGDQRIVAAGSWSKKRIGAVQEKAGVTGNDVVVAVIGGVLRSWLLDRGELPEQSLVTLCPITVRSHEQGQDDVQGNQFGPWLCPLGTDLRRPGERLDLIHRSMSEESSGWPAAGREHRCCC